MIRLASLLVLIVACLCAEARSQCSNGSFGVQVTFIGGSGSYCVDTNVLIDGPFEVNMDGQVCEQDLADLLTAYDAQ
jgi:hypothetical protein